MEFKEIGVYEEVKVGWKKELWRVTKNNSKGYKMIRHSEMDGRE